MPKGASESNQISRRQVFHVCRGRLQNSDRLLGVICEVLSVQSTVFSTYLFHTS